MGEACPRCTRCAGGPRRLEARGPLRLGSCLESHETSPPPHHRGIRNFRVVACVLVAQESSLHLLRLLQFAQREWSPLFFLSVTFIAPRRARRARASLTPRPPHSPRGRTWFPPRMPPDPAPGASSTTISRVNFSPSPLLSITTPPLTLTRDLGCHCTRPLQCLCVVSDSFQILSERFGSEVTPVWTEGVSRDCLSGPCFRTLTKNHTRTLATGGTWQTLYLTQSQVIVVFFVCFPHSRHPIH